MDSSNTRLKPLDHKKSLYNQQNIRPIANPLAPVKKPLAPDVS